MFKRLLVANRGEIAVRIFRTARRLGIHTIAVYSDADVDATHVRLADEAWHLGPEEPRESYLNVAKLLEIAHRSGADSIHPGYGFLSERAEFAAACAAAGVVFVGPPAAAMAAMGSKSAAKEAMQRAGLPVLPGYHGCDQSPERLLNEAKKIGFPLIIKPSGGGGGKGMQIVYAEAELASALASATRLAQNAFGDATLLLERYLPAPRHVEVQLIADANGMVHCLASRDCSVQRRHQKLIEEAPAPDIAEDVRASLHAAGCAVARAVGYQNAGTVEFLYADGKFWFMEMNTRLQVEHTVTEEVLGIDLVEWQLRIAAGESLPPAAETSIPCGHAIEVRICAEDATAGFAPSAGRLTHVRWPTGIPGVRVDAGFETGDSVTPTYDSLLGKIIAHGNSRGEAILKLRHALAALRIVGVETNAGWLADALSLPAFFDVAPTTRFVADYGDTLAAVTMPTALELSLAAIAFIGGTTAASHSPWARRDAFRVGLPQRQSLTLRVTGIAHLVNIEYIGGDWRIDAAGETLVMTAQATHGRLTAVVNGCRVEHDAVMDGTTLSLWRGANRLDFELVDLRRSDFRASAHAGELIARLPGTVVSVEVAVGDHIAAGATMMVIEAMKMEHSVVAPYAGRLSAIHYGRGDRVTEGTVLVEVIPAESPAVVNTK